MAAARSILSTIYRNTNITLLAFLTVNLTTVILAAEIEQTEVESFTLVHKLGDKKVTTHYAPSLFAIYQETGREGILIDFFAEHIYWYVSGSNKRLLRQRSFRDFRAADQAIHEYSRLITGFTPPQLEPTAGQPWRFLQPITTTKKDASARCANVRLVNALGEELEMCVIRDHNVRRLDFLNRYYRAMPKKVQAILESSAELFLYSEGVIPMVGKRRGKPFELVEYKHWWRPKRDFQPPPKGETVTPPSRYPRIYLEASQESVQN